MRSIIAFPLVMGAAAVSQASAAAVSFDPPVAVLSPGETAEFLVSITSTDFPAFQAIDMFFTDEFGTLWEPTILDLSFAYVPSFVASCTLPPYEPSQWFCDPWPCWMGAGGFNGNEWTVTDESPLVIGTLSVDTAALEPGTYQIYTDANMERKLFGVAFSGISNAFDVEDIYGQATVIVPEPATISLFGLAVLWASRRQCQRPRQRRSHPAASRAGEES